MVNLVEMIALLEKYDRFLTLFSVKLLRGIGEGHAGLESKIISIIKGTIFPVPLDILCGHLQRLTDQEVAREKVVEAVFERYHLLLEMRKLVDQQIGKELSLQPLKEWMERGETFERAFALTVLSNWGDVKARELLQSGFDHFPQILRWGIITILEHQGDWQWMPLFLAALEDTAPDVVRVAVTALGKSRISTASEKLIPLLSHSSDTVAISAIRALTMLGDDNSIPHLCRLAEITASDKIRATVVSAMGDFPGEDLVPFLTNFLYHADSRVRANAIQALKRKFLALGKSNDEVTDRIKGLLGDSDHRVKADVIQCLWELGCTQNLTAVEDMMKSTDEGARLSGTYICGKLKLQNYRELLIGLTNDSSWKVRKTAALALLGFGNAGRDIIHNMLSQGTPDQQVCAAYAAGLADDPKGIDVLLSTSRSGTELAEMATDFLLKLSKPVDL